jgi:lipopolysaccharide transport system ATP-binding protein
MEKLLEQGTSILLVSHDTSAIRKYCDTSLLLEDGQNIFYGDVETAVSKYFFQRVPNSSSSSPRQEKNETVSMERQTTSKQEDKRKIQEICNGSNDSASIADPLLVKWPEPSEFIDLKSKDYVGDLGSAHFVSAALCNKNYIKSNTFAQGEWAHFFWEIEIFRDIEVPVGGLTITTSSNLAVYSRCTSQSERDFPVYAKKGDIIRFKTSVKLDLQFGNYFFTPGLGEMSVVDYTQRLSLSVNNFFHSLSPIILATSVDFFTVQEPKEGLKYPFFGLADIPSTCSMTLLKNGHSDGLIL